MGSVKRVIVVTDTGDYQRLKEPVALTTPVLSDNGTKPVWIEGDSLGGGGSSAAEDVSVADAGNFFSGTDVEAVLQELAGGGPIDHGTLAGLSDDDHPQYADQTEFDDHHARHEAGGADEIDATGLTGAGSGITDHGDLTGLGDDDHPQYTTDAEATTIAVTEAGAAVSDHAAAPDPHLGYLTPAEGNAAYSATGHAHTHAATTGQTANDHHAQSHTQADHDAAEAADIAAVGTAAAAGTSAEVPNADHVHAHEAAHINHDTTWAVKGDLIAATANDAAAVVPVGTAGQLLLPDSAASAGLAWFDALFPTMMLPTGAIAATAARSTPFGNINLLASGRITLCGIWLPKGRTITSISFVSATVPLAVGTNQWFALYDSSRALLRVTSDDTSTVWAANSVKTLNLSSTFDTTYAGLHYVAIMVAATTVPTLTCVTTSATLNALAPVLCGSCNTGLTNPASAPNPASNFPTGAGVVPYAYVS